MRVHCVVRRAWGVGLVALLASTLATAEQGDRLIRGGGFALTDQAGRAVTDHDFRGQFMLIYFGYTHCPDVCPTGLSVMTQAMQALGDASQSVQPLFITFDPKRDTVSVLADYMPHFHPRFLGLTGSKEQVFAAANAYGVEISATYAANTPGIDYSMNHSAFTYLVGPDGRLRSMYREGIDGETMAAAIRRHLGK
ncbi:MAG: SCO family protein [Deltaproteobacteria bacterium]|nr:SCO family protein [Deltaproteobacteria bacterium]